MSELENDAAEIDTVDAVTDEADALNGAEPSASAESSAAEDVSKPEGEETLSVVRDVVDGKSKPAAASSADGAEGGQQPGAKATKEPKEPDNENFTDVPFHKHPRFQEVVSKLKTAEIDAQRYRNVETFIDEQGLSGDEAAGLLQIGGLIKTNPAEAWKRMQPVVQKVLIAAGELLPDDLKQMVSEGKMTPESALEVSRSRAAVTSIEARTQFDQKRLETRQQADQRNAIQGTVSSWQTERKSRDPNFEAKMPALQREIAWLQAREGRPNTPEGVKAQLQKAYDAVSAAYTPPATARKKPAIRPITGGQAASGNARPEINDTLDVVQSVIARRAG